MAISERVNNAVKALLGISSYQATIPESGAPIDSAMVEERRRHTGGNLQPLVTTRLKWYLKDLETCQSNADAGNLREVGQLARSMLRDAVISGLLKVRTAGLVSLPKRFRGDQKIIDVLQNEASTRSVFDEMFPPSELALLASDGIKIGVGVAEMVPVPGRDYPVMVRLEPEFLQYRWGEGRWYYNSVAGPIPITPGDGRWILHTPGGRMNPWQSGSWHCLGAAFIRKEHAKLMRSNFSGKLANPARVAKAPLGSTEEDRSGFMNAVMSWGINTVFTLLPGWDIELIESNGRGWEVFSKEIDDSNFDVMIAIAGQVVTVTGGTGFANASIHETIAATLIKDTSDALAYTINTQGIPPWEVKTFGVDALENTVRLSWDIRPPLDQLAEAQALTATSDAIGKFAAQMASQGMVANVKELVDRYGLPIDASATPPETKVVKLSLAPTDIAKVVKVDEARGSQGLGPIGDERGKLTIAELEDIAKEKEVDPSAAIPAE